MADYIKREAADKALTLSAANDKDQNHRIWAKAICVLHDLPAADVAPVRQGRWGWFDKKQEHQQHATSANGAGDVLSAKRNFRMITTILIVALR